MIALGSAAVFPQVIATGDIARILTVRSVAVLGLAGTGVLDERKGRRCPIEWARFALGEIGKVATRARRCALRRRRSRPRWAFRVVPSPARGIL